MGYLSIEKLQYIYGWLFEYTKIQEFRCLEGVCGYFSRNTSEK